jgi:hypothetical protein
LFLLMIPWISEQLKPHRLLLLLNRKWKAAIHNAKLASKILHLFNKVHRKSPKGNV